MVEGYDVVVVGGGHNGLVAAAYLARQGRRVLVLEGRGEVGGVASEEVFDGSRLPLGLPLCGLLRPRIIQELDLKGRGLQFLPLDPTVVAFGNGGRSLVLWRDMAKTRDAIVEHSNQDAEAYPRFHTMMVELAKVVGPLLTRTPPDVVERSKADILYYLRRGYGLRRLGKEAMRQGLRLPPMALADLVREWFETDLLQATVAADGLLGAFRGPKSPGTGFNLLQHYVPEADGGSWAYVRGGMSSLAKALATAAEASGATIRTGVEVKRVVTTTGRVEGVELASGERITARAVVSSADPKRTLLGLVDPEELEPNFILKLRNFRTEGCVSRVNLVLDGLPHMPPGTPVGASRFRICPDVEYLERAFDEAKRGRFSPRPFLDVTIPTIADPGLAPAGRHVMSIWVQYTPYHLRKGKWEDWREEMGDLVVDTLAGYLPALQDKVLHRQVLTPFDLEQRLGVTEGHLFHGEMSLNQLFVLRPIPGWARYRTPIEGLYLCGSGTHPGGGITGAPGYNAAREVLKDWPSLAPSK